MKFTYKWLKKFLDTEYPAKKIAEELTKIGVEVEEIIDRDEDLSDLRVGYVETVEQHPNADKLSLCSVFDGKRHYQVICGAPNVKQGMKVVLALAGCVIPKGSFKLRDTKIRGVDSFGMLCSAEELLVEDLFDDNSSCISDGIIELSNDAIAGDKILSYLGLDDVVFDVSITPNRGDLFGVYGIARDLAAKNIGNLKPINPPELKEEFQATISCEIENQNDTKLLSFRQIKNINNCQSPSWLKNLLQMVGMKPVSAVVDITNYFSISFGRPLHAYDKQKIGNQLISSSAKELLHSLGSTNFKALNEKEYILEEEDLVIHDKKNVLAFAGVIGGEDSKCDVNTDNIVLECAVFDKVKVAQIGRKHSIITDSRTRFERGIDHDKTIFYLDYAAKMIQDICGGEISTTIISGKERSDKEILKFNTSLLSSRIGLNISLEKVKNIIKNLGFEILQEEYSQEVQNIENESPLIMEVKIPSWRHDINCPEVIAEEVARIYGYDKISEKKFEIDALQRVQNRRNKMHYHLLRSTSLLGYKEVVTWSFIDSKIAKYFSDIDEYLKLKNPISSDLDYMRPSIIPCLLSAVDSNIKRSSNNLAIFEFGPVFSSIEPEGQHSSISGLISGDMEESSHCNKNRKVDVFDIKAHVEYLLKESGLESGFKIDSKGAPKYYHPGRSGAYKLGNKVIAYFGQIHPKILKLFDIKDSVCAFEIMLDNIPEPRARFGRRKTVNLSLYQKTDRDFAFIVDEDLESEGLVSMIKNVDSLIQNVEVFDVYKGANIPEGKKSLAVNVTLQSYNKTLSEEEIEGISEKIITKAKNKFLAELRSN